MKPRLAVLPLILLLCCGSKLARIEKMQAAGENAEVVAQVQKWRDKKQLGKEEEVLLAAMAKSAYTLALAEDKSAALRQFREQYPDSPLCADALKREYDLAFTEAQAEGTVAGMGDYLRWYPESPYKDRAAVLQQGWAYEDVVAEGTLEALDRFLATAGDSPYKASAWEAVAAKQPGIQVLDPAGRPVALTGLPVTDGRITVPSTLPEGTARLVYAVNVDGAGRGASSEWFTLQALTEDGTLTDTTPLEAAVSASLRFPLQVPELRLLATTPGAHTARVAHSVHPLSLPGTCTGAGHYAFVLRSPGGAATAWPFKVNCPKGALSAWSDTPMGLLTSALTSFDAGDRKAAYAFWDKLVALPSAAPLVEALAAGTGGSARDVLDLRPSPGDFLVWTAAATGVETVWLHEDGDGKPRVLARRPEVVVGNTTSLTALRPTSEPWSAPGCTTTTLAGAALVPLGGGEPKSLFPDAAPRLAGMGARTLTPTFSIGPYLIVEEQAAPCRGNKLPAPTRRVLRVADGSSTSELDDPAMVQAAVDAARANLTAANDLAEVDKLTVLRAAPAFVNGADLGWTVALGRGKAPPVDVVLPPPAALRDWTDTPALVEAWWRTTPPGASAGWSRVLADTANSFLLFSAPAPAPAPTPTP